MKRLLLSVCLIGIVFAGHTPNSLQTTQIAPVSAEPIDAARGVTIVAKSTPDRWNRTNPSVQRIAFRSSSITDTPEASSAKGSALVPSVDEIFAPALPQKTEAPAQPQPSEAVGDDAMWVVVIRGASVHSGPSVSAPIVSYFAAGKELNLVGSEQGWYQVFDPATSQLGWVYAKYYVEPIDGPNRKRVAVVEETQAPIRAAPVAAAPSKPVRHILQQPQFLAPPQVQAEKVQASPRSRDESVASLLERALQR
jgi:hypothetical protein